MRVLVRSLALAIALAAIPLAGVAAHECIVVNRSATGNEHASGSGRWFTLTLEQLFSDTEDFGFPDLTPAQVEYAANLSFDSGVPASFTFRADKTLLENAAGWQKNGHSTDGKGIDHFFDVYGETLIGAIFAALQNA